LIDAQAEQSATAPRESMRNALPAREQFLIIVRDSNT
jgi:hypothetical protein